ncbi:ester cyclase [Pseudonocardia sp.]|uniref:ester cyclase n=1 Tax=Pseudonocardia sp. TaxID=60912 RepID=UPI003D0CCA54
MTAFAHKALLCSLYDQVVNAGQLRRIPEFLAPGFVGHLSGLDSPVRGPAGFAEVIVALRSTFPDLNTAIEGGWLLHELDTHVVGKGRSIDRLAALVVYRGTSRDHAEMTWSEAVFGRVEDGRIAELITVADPLIPVRSDVLAGTTA